MPCTLPRARCHFWMPTLLTRGKRIATQAFFFHWACVGYGSSWCPLRSSRFPFQTLLQPVGPVLMHCLRQTALTFFFFCPHSANEMCSRACFIDKCWVLSFFRANPLCQTLVRSLLRASRSRIAILRLHFLLWSSCDRQCASDKMIFHK